MPLGLHGAPRTFQCTMNVILYSVYRYFTPFLTRRYSRFHLNAAAIHRSCTQRLSSIIQRRCHTQINEAQMFFGYRRLLGSYNLSMQHGSRFSQEDAIRKLQSPTNFKEIWLLFGCSNVFRWVLPNFSRLTAPLSQCLRNYQPVTFQRLTGINFKPMNRSKTL